MDINTISGLGKHEASSIDNAFTSGKTIDQVLDYLASYHPVKGIGWEKFSEEDFQVHVPRWIEETKRAYVRLSKYRSEHSF
jgi:hypothetical protein